MTFSLEQDLIATAQNIVPVIAPGISVSPYRIVRIVDREGHITSIRENAETTLECTRQGYYRNPEDCSQFYRCVKFNQYENDYTIFEYACPAMDLGQHAIMQCMFHLWDMKLITSLCR